MHRKHIRATVGTADVDIPIATFIADRFLYYNGLTIITVSALRGPATATDNAVTRFDGTTGQLVQNSLVIIDDAGAVTGVTTLNTRDPARWVDGPAAGGSTDNAIARWDSTTGRLLQNSVVLVDDAGAVTGITSIGGVPVSDFVRGPTPAVAVDNHIATWDLTSGRLIQDSGLHVGDVVFNLDAEAVTGHLVEFFDSTGRRVTDSGLVADNVVQATSTSTDNAVARFDGTTGRFIQNSLVIISDAGLVTGVVQLNGTDPAVWVRGPASAVNGNVAAFSGTTGKAIFDTGIVNSTIVIGPSSANDNRIARFDGGGGKLIQNSGITINDAAGIDGVVQLNGFDIGLYCLTSIPANVGRIPSYNGSNSIAETGISVSGGNNISGAGTLNTRTIANWVDGPSSATDNAVARFDATTGKLIQNSVVIIADTTGNITGAGTLNTRTIANWVDGPASATDNAVARFDATTGKLIQNSVVIIADTTGNITGVGTLNTRTIANWVDGPASVTDSRVAVFDGTTGKLLKEGTQLAANLVSGPASATDNAVARFDATTGKLIQNSVAIISDAGAVTGVTTINAVDITTHAARHLTGGADSMFSGTWNAANADVPVWQSAGGTFTPRFIRSSSSGGGSAGGSYITIVGPETIALRAPSGSRINALLLIPYVIGDTGSDIQVAASWNNCTAVCAVSAGNQGGVITTSGGTGTLDTATGQMSPGGLISVLFNCVYISGTASVTFQLRSSASAHTIYPGLFWVFEDMA